MAGLLIYLALVLTTKHVHCQALPSLQSSLWNSTFKFSANQLSLASLTAGYGSVVENVINFDRTQLANGGPFADDFYNMPENIKVPTRPGMIIKVQEYTDPRSWSIPASTAMSRIMYSTQNLNGTLIPASAYILWPYQAKRFRGQSPNTVPVVLWTHGTSGFYASGAPSAHRSLFYSTFAPFTLAEAGYVVIAPDYAGLGVGKSWDGKSIPHQYLIREAGANDALNAVRAAQTAFTSRLSQDFVLMGHSQGGAIAWGLSELLARKNSPFKDLIPRHLGTVLAAPPTDAHSLPPELLLPWTGKDFDQIYPHFNLSEWLTPLGVARTELMNQVEASQMVTTYLMLTGDAIVKPEYQNTVAFKNLLELAEPGRLPFKGPMLILQGSADPAVPYNTTVKAVQDTCRTQKGDLELTTVDGAGHFGVLNAGKQTYLSWIASRFEGRPISRRGCGVKTELKSFLSTEMYQSTPNSYLQWASKPEWSYELPTAA